MTVSLVTPDLQIFKHLSDAMEYVQKAHKASSEYDPETAWVCYDANGDKIDWKIDAVKMTLRDGNFEMSILRRTLR